MSVVSSEFILVQHHHLHHPEWRNLSQKHGLTKTWSSPYLYNPQVRVPPIHHHHTGTESDEPVAKVLYPTEAHFPHVPLDVPVKLVILGSPQVGKSALALRYLTKNQTSGSSGDRRGGRQRSPVIAVEVEILDVKAKATNKLLEFGLQLKNCDAIIVMYSLTDRVSFHVARELLDDLANLASVTCPVLLLANKMDLCHHRKVTITEGRELARAFTQDIITFHEVSVAHCPDDIMKIFTRLLKAISHNKNAEKLPACSQSFHGTKDLNKPEMMSNSAMAASSSSASTSSRLRKPNVFCVAGRMLNNLMGRNSVPPELPSSSSSSQPNSPISTTEGVFSFRKVFKKRSV